MVDEHLEYVSDRTRMALFSQAIASLVKPGSKVVDLGSGSGVLALMCLQAGAGQVDAIDSSSAIDLARGTLEGAGFADRTRFHHALTSRVDLPREADIILCDHVGYFGFDYGLIELLADARRRFLKPGGVQVPRRLRLFLSAVDSEKCREECSAWAAPEIPPEFHWIRANAVNRVHPKELKGADLIAEPVLLAELNLMQDQPEFMTFTANLTLQRQGAMDGLLGWFECELSEGVWMTNSPVSAAAIARPQAYLPLSEAIKVNEGDVIEATIMARPADEVVTWQVRRPNTGELISQSTLHSSFGSAVQKLLSLRPDHVPQLGRLGRARQLVLGYCDGRRSRAEIHEAVARDHPDLLPTRAELSKFINEVLAQDGSS